MDKKLLVKRAPSYYHNPDFGLLQPIAHIDENGLCESINNIEKKFPNGKIWVSKGYGELDTRIGDDELFILERWEFSGEGWQDNPNKHQYYAFGNAAQKLSAHEFIPIIEHESLPDKTTGHLSDITTPSNNYFFILIKDNNKDNNAVYGPFKVIENKQEKSKILSIPPQTPLNLGQDNIAKYDYQTLCREGVLVTFLIDNEEKVFIRKTHNLKGIKYESIDYISDKSLIKLFMKQDFLKEGKNAFGKSEVKKLQKIIEDYGSKKIKFFENTDRLERIQKLLGDFLGQVDYEQEIIHKFLFKTDDGKAFLNSYFEKHKDRLLEDKKFELEEEFSEKKSKLMADLNKLEEQKKIKKDEITELQELVLQEEEKAKDTINKIKSQTEEETHQELYKRQNELLEKKNKLESEIKDLERNIKSFYDEHDKIKKFEDLNKKIDRFDEKIMELDEKDRELKKAIDEKKHWLQSTRLGDELIKFDTIRSVLTNRPSYEEKNLDIDLIKSRKLNFNDKQDFINNIVEVFNKDGGRPFTFDETANLIICLSQSFLTILSGPPGTGKTSTALRLAKYMGLVNDTNKISKNFLNIAVGRGWTSSRDILGFYNSLKDVYQPARTGLYQFLKGYSNKEFQDHKFLKFVLMDEANLSSIEHYWSDFLAMCDSDVAKTIIDLGIPDHENRYLKIPDSLRFIATINNDDTTEKLSPRLIDRSPIISLSYSYEDTNEDDDDETIIDAEGAVLYEELENHFNVSLHEAKLESEEKKAFNKIIETLKDNSFNSKIVEISYRKKNAIYKYCYIANQLGFRGKPMDFAISQHILPLVNGSGAVFKERLENLRDVLDEYNYVRSRKILDEIIRSSEYDFYSFF